MAASSGLLSLIDKLIANGANIEEKEETTVIPYLLSTPGSFMTQSCL
jgi:hypothetical protein